MNLKKRCSACKKYKLWFLVKKRTYAGPKVITGKVTSDTAICTRCHENAKLLILGEMSLRHKWNALTMILINKYDSLRRKKAK